LRARRFFATLIEMGKILVLGALLLGACGDEGVTGGNDMNATPTCTELCQEYATCYEMANPGFMGSANALVPCENTCFSLSEEARDSLRTCAMMDCSAFITCAMNDGLKLMPKPDAG